MISPIFGGKPPSPVGPCEGSDRRRESDSFDRRESESRERDELAVYALDSSDSGRAVIRHGPSSSRTNCIPMRNSISLLGDASFTNDGCTSATLKPAMLS